MKTFTSILAAAMLSVATLPSMAQDGFPNPASPWNGSCADRIVRGQNLSVHCLSADENRGSRSSGGWQNIHYAAYHGRTDVVQAILANASDLATSNTWGGDRWSHKNGAQIAMIRGYYDTAKAFGTASYSVPTSTTDGCVELIASGSTDLNSYLFEDCWLAGNVQRTNFDGWSYVALAAEAGNNFYLRLQVTRLSEFFRAVNKQGEGADGFTPLALALNRGNTSTAELLYQMGHPAIRGYTPSDNAKAVLFNAISSGTLKTMPLYNPFPPSLNELNFQGANDPRMLVRNAGTPSEIINYTSKEGVSVLHLLMQADKRGSDYAGILATMLNRNDVECKHTGATQCGTDSIHAWGSPVAQWMGNSPTAAFPAGLVSACKDVFPLGNGGTANEDADCLGEAPVQTVFESNLYGGYLHVALVEWDMSGDQDEVAIECISEGGNETGGTKRNCGTFHAMAWPSQPYSEDVTSYCPYSSPAYLRAGEVSIVSLSAVLGASNDETVGCAFMSDAPFTVTIQ